MLERKEIAAEINLLMNQTITSDVKFIPLKDEFVKAKLPAMYKVILDTAKAFGLQDQISDVGNTFALSVTDHHVRKLYEPTIYLYPDGLAIRWGSSVFPLKDIIEKITHKTDYQFREINNAICLAYLADADISYIKVFPAKSKDGIKEAAASRIAKLTKCYNDGDWTGLSTLVAEPFLRPEKLSTLPVGKYQGRKHQV